MKYLGIGQSVGMQNENKPFSTVILYRQLCNAPRIHAGEGNQDSPAALTCSPFSTPDTRDERTQPHAGSGEGGRVSHLPQI